MWDGSLYDQILNSSIYYYFPLFLSRRHEQKFVERRMFWYNEKNSQTSHPPTRKVANGKTNLAPLYTLTHIPILFDLHKRYGMTRSPATHYGSQVSPEIAGFPPPHHMCRGPPRALGHPCSNETAKGKEALQCFAKLTCSQSFSTHITCTLSLIHSDTSDSIGDN